MPPPCGAALGIAERVPTWPRVLPGRTSAAHAGNQGGGRSWRCCPRFPAQPHGGTPGSGDHAGEMARCARTPFPRERVTGKPQGGALTPGAIRGLQPSIRDVRSSKDLSPILAPGRWVTLAPLSSCTRTFQGKGHGGSYTCQPCCRERWVGPWHPNSVGWEREKAHPQIPGHPSAVV